MRRRDKLFRRMKKIKNEKDVRKYKDWEKVIQKSERLSYGKYINNIIEVGDQGDRRQRKQKRFRKYIKSFWIDATGIAPLKGNERLFNASKDKADISRQYQSVHTNTVLEPDGDPYP